MSLKFAATADNTDRAKLKAELEEYGGNYDLCVTLEMISDLLWLVDLDLILP